MILREVFKPICMVLATCIIFGAGSPSVFAYSSSRVSQEKIKEMVPFLEVIESMPGDLLEEGDSKKINQYFRKKGITLKFQNEQHNRKMRVKRGVWKCSITLTAVIAGSVIPIMKLKKIKDAIERIGGVAKTIKAFVIQRQAGALTQEIAKHVAIIAAELIGFTEVYEACFED